MANKHFLPLIATASLLTLIANHSIAGEVMTVTKAVAAQRSISDVIVVSGRIQAVNERLLTPSVQNKRIWSVEVERGQLVGVNKLLATVDFDNAKYEQDKALQLLVASEVDLQTAKRALDRGKMLFERNAISLEKLETLEKDEAKARSTHQSALSEYKIAEKSLQDTQMRAPFAGVVTDVAMKAGEMATTQSSITIAEGGAVEALVHVPEKYLTKLAVGQTAVVELLDGNKLQGELRRVSPIVDPTTGMAEVHVIVQTSGFAFIGMFVSATINVTPTVEIAVPRASVTFRDGMPTVFVIGKDSIVKAVSVELGAVVGDDVIVSGNISNGTEVVVAGAGFLNDDDQVAVTASVSGE